MPMVSLGDMAYHYQLGRQSLMLKQQVLDAGQALTTGQVSDLTAHLGGDMAPLAAIQHDLRVLSAYDLATSEAALQMSAIQLALEQISGGVQDTSTALVMAGDGAQATLVDTAGTQALSALDQAMAALNTTVAGRSVFAGADTDRAAVVTAQTLLSQVQTAASGQTTAQGVAAAVDAWFADPVNGYAANGYLGSAQHAGPVTLADGVRFDPEINAAHADLRPTLAALASAALLADPGFLAGNVAERAALAQSAGVSLLSAESGYVRLQANVGTLQAEIDTVSARNQAQGAALEMARADPTGADPYAAAARLEMVQGQLETLYAITARVSRLNLADFL